MRRTHKLMLAALPLLALSACGSSEAESADTTLHIVGSSTVYPFSVAVANAAMEANPEVQIRVRSTGTADGIAAFCAGAPIPVEGDEDAAASPVPDSVNASRRMTAEEFATCQANGVTDIVELRVGTDGVVFVSASDGGLSMNLTPRVVYTALAAEPFGEEQANLNWSDVDSSLPNEAIEVYGPPSSSGTRQSLLELVLEVGCAENRSLAGLELSEPERYAEVCSSLRTDSGFLDQGENDDLIVRKVANNERALAVVGYSWFEENQDIVQAMTFSGVEPNEETISSGAYPASRPLYIYVNKARVEAVPGLQPYVAAWVASWDGSGPLANIGFIPAHDDQRAAMADRAANMTVLTEADLSGE